MKRFLLWLLSISLILSLTACNGDSAEEQSSLPESTSQIVSDTLVTTSLVTTTSIANTTTSVATTSVKESSAVTTTSVQSVKDIITVTSAPTYSGDYLEDVNIGDLKYDYNSLKAKLQTYVSSCEPTSFSGTSKIYDLSNDAQTYALLGYSSDKFDKTDISVVADKDGKVTSFNLQITAAYKTAEFAERLIKQDYEKLKAFTLDSEVNYFIAFEYGNPDEYKSYAELNGTKDAQKVYKGMDNSTFISLHYLNEDKSIKTLFTVGSANENGVLKLSSKIRVNF